MGTDTGIEYADHSLNFWRGCQPVDECCDHCYAADNAKQYGWDFSKVQRTSKSTWRQPFVKDRGTGRYKWQTGDRIFVCSLSDFFHKDADEWRQDAMGVFKDRPDLVWLIVTKRIERAAGCFNLTHDFSQKNYPNIWIVPTCGTQKMADARIPVALELKAKYPWIKIGVSAEPLLEEIDIDKYSEPCICPECGNIETLDGYDVLGAEDDNVFCNKCGYEVAAKCEQGIDQVFIGCESGPKRRPCKLEDVRSIVDRCEESPTACFVKQVNIDGRVVKDPVIIERLGLPQELAD